MPVRRRLGIPLTVAMTVALTVAGLLGAGAAGAASAAGPPRGFPETIALPAGSQPEGITSGPGTTFYAGARTDGAIVRGDVRTGRSSVLVPGAPGAVAVGMQYDRSSGRLWVAGGATGTVTAYDADTGEQLGRWVVPPAAGAEGIFLNDVAVTRWGVYVTDSSSGSLVVVPTGRLGDLAAAGAPTRLPLTGDFRLTEGFNANGIRALPGGKTLLVVQSSTGKLFRVDSVTGAATVVPFEGPGLATGDGLELRGDTLYVVYGSGADGVVVVDLGPRARSARIVGEVTDADLDRPTTATLVLGRLYVVNGRFGVTPEPDTTYEIVKLPAR